MSFKLIHAMYLRSLFIVLSVDVKSQQKSNTQHMSTYILLCQNYIIKILEVDAVRGA